LTQSVRPAMFASVKLTNSVRLPPSSVRRRPCGLGRDEPHAREVR
jgi:hypothetical protein